MSGPYKPSSTSQQYHLTITINNTDIENEENKNYISYQIDYFSSLTNVTNDTNFSSSVLRRYSDFVWLYNALQVERAGSIIAPLPEKKFIKNKTSEFLKHRRDRLEKFLRQLIVHPELLDTKCLYIFLHTDDQIFHEMKKINHIEYNNDTNNPSYQIYFSPTSPKTGSSVKKWLNETKTLLSRNLVNSPDDHLFVEIESYIEKLSNQLNYITTAITKSIQKEADVSNGFVDLSTAFRQLGQFEPELFLSYQLSKFGQSAQKISQVTRQETEFDHENLEQEFIDITKIIHAVKIAIQKRTEKRVIYTICLSEVSSKKSAYMKICDVPGLEGKSYRAELSLKWKTSALEYAKRDFHNVSQRLLREMDRFKKDLRYNINLIIQRYINQQVEYNKRKKKIWNELLISLGNLKMEDFL